MIQSGVIVSLPLPCYPWLPSLLEMIIFCSSVGWFLVFLVFQRRRSMRGGIFDHFIQCWIPSACWVTAQFVLHICVHEFHNGYNFLTLYTIFFTQLWFMFSDRKTQASPIPAWEAFEGRYMSTAILYHPKQARSCLKANTYWFASVLETTCWPNWSQNAMEAGTLIKKFYNLSKSKSWPAFSGSLGI